MTDIKLRTQAILRASAKTPTAFKWTLQGLGMLRMYLSEEVRLHVWNSYFKIADVSPLHTHPWSFNYYVVAGLVKNRRYSIGPGEVYNRALITCGAGAKVEETDQVTLKPGEVEEFETGEHYNQWASEIHESFPEDGTVTLVQRHFGNDREHAYVFWKDTPTFVSAEPRPATPEEVTAFCTIALAKYF